MGMKSKEISVSTWFASEHSVGKRPFRLYVGRAFDVAGILKRRAITYPEYKSRYNFWPPPTMWGSIRSPSVFLCGFFRRWNRLATVRNNWSHRRRPFPFFHYCKRRSQIYFRIRVKRRRRHVRTANRFANVQERKWTFFPLFPLRLAIGSTEILRRRNRRIVFVLLGN